MFPQLTRCPPQQIHDVQVLLRLFLFFQQQPVACSNKILHTHRVKPLFNHLPPNTHPHKSVSLNQLFLEEDGRLKDELMLCTDEYFSLVSDKGCFKLLLENRFDKLNSRF